MSEQGKPIVPGRLLFDRRYLLALHKFHAVNDVRYYLNGLYFEKQKDCGVVIVATDGHMIACGFDPNAEMDNEHLIVQFPSRFITACKKGEVNGMQYGQVFVQDGIAYQSPDGASTDAARINNARDCGVATYLNTDGHAKFPNWRGVYHTAWESHKENTGNLSSCLNLNYLARFKELAEGDSPFQKNQGARFLFPADEGQAVICIPQSRLNLVGMVMPMRIEVASADLPDYIAKDNSVAASKKKRKARKPATKKAA